jgi:hypothetical protein
MPQFKDDALLNSMNEYEVSTMLRKSAQASQHTLPQSIFDVFGV